ncbi:NAD-dependent succinate-semialdehyde dehydrogenase [Lewinella sp. 4G2]|uniref:NAD-dependent succinate-semialdehyde dehydrogenase n=1 Tax=Lewinella sp. 4G2 TaxID=1803372 RepID=UPI000AE4D512|nr:NAD-dependent succinate-semialdehyde dehydrogenase [Lewinella sp. 4G2]
MLVRNQAYIGGAWVDSTTAKSFAVTNPASGARIAMVTDCGAPEARQAIEVAASALEDWKLRPATERASILRAWYDEVDKHHDSLASLMTAEQGKPLGEAASEVRYGANYLAYYAAEAERIAGDLLTNGPNSESRIHQVPVGVVAIITPWNFPLAMIARKVAPALAAGCTVIIKPAEDTPLTALALAVLAEQAGVPAGVVNVLPTSNPTPLAQVLLDSMVVRKLSFTGSTAVGKLLMRESAETLKRLSLELGGNAPFIVFQNADLDGAVAGAMQGKFRNAGQTCICPNRFLVHEKFVDAFTEKLMDRMAALIVGPGNKDGTDIGPLINEAAAKKVDDLIADAVTKGAQLVMGGKRSALGGTYFEPTLLTGCKPSMDLWRQEIFGPVVAITTFASEREALEMANDTDAGLAAYFYSNNVGQIRRVSAALHSGMVGINTGAISDHRAPFGGVGASGFGREGGPYGIEEYLTTKYLRQQF